MRVAMLVTDVGAEHGDPAFNAVVAADAWPVASDSVTAVGVVSGGPRGGPPAGTLRIDVVPGVVAGVRDDSWWLAPQAGVWSASALADALDQAAARRIRRVVIPVGDDAARDDPLALWRSDLEQARGRWAAMQLDVLVSSDAPLLGFHGMSALAAERGGGFVTLHDAQADEEHWSQVARIADPIASKPTLLGSARLSETQGTGAASGLAYCLAAAGGNLRQAAAYVADAAAWDAAATGADLVVAVVGVLDPAQVDRGVTAVVARTAAGMGVPAVVLAAEVAVGRRDLMAAGIAAAHEMPASDSEIEALTAGVKRLGHTWSPRRNED